MNWFVRSLIVALIASGHAATAASGHAATAVTGQYGPLLLVVNGNAVSGIYYEGSMGGGTLAGPQFSCIFMLRGTLANGRADIETWYPGDTQIIPGRLALSSGKVAFTLRDNPDGCLMARGDMVRQPVEETLVRPRPDWIDVRLVAAPRAAINAAPRTGARRARYVRRGNVLVVLARRERWVKVGYLGGILGAGRPAQGRFPASALAPDTPPMPAARRRAGPGLAGADRAAAA